MAIKAFIANQQKRISWPGDIEHPADVDNPTVFIIQAVPHHCGNWIADQCYTDQGVADGSLRYQFKKGNALFTMCGLFDIENFPHPETGEIIKVKTQVLDLYGQGKHRCVSAETLDLLPRYIADWLQKEIQKLGGVSEEDKKKSEEPFSASALSSTGTAPNAPPASNASGDVKTT